MEEIWKDVIGFEGYYQVSNLGKVRSLDRIVEHTYSKKLTLKGVEMKPQINFGGYCQVRLCKDNNTRGYVIHRLVAQAFIPNPDNKPQVNHINGIKTDNRVENLEWVTHRENAIHAFKNNLVKTARGEDQGKAKLTEEVVIELRKMRSSGYQYKELAKMTGLTHRTVRAACIGFTWAHVDYPFCDYVEYK